MWLSIGYQNWNDTKNKYCPSLQPIPERVRSLTKRSVNIFCSTMNRPITKSQLILGFGRSSRIFYDRLFSNFTLTWREKSSISTPTKNWNFLQVTNYNSFVIDMSPLFRALKIFPERPLVPQLFRGWSLFHSVPLKNMLVVMNQTNFESFWVRVNPWFFILSYCCCCIL